MIFEIAHIAIKQDMSLAFEDGVRRAAGLFKSAEGCTSFRLERGIEEPLNYLLIVGWRSVDDHMLTFRASDAFAQWRALVGSCFAEPPQVRHVETVVDAF
ncbi:quinol monooxygenase YgiN [Sphingobium sp. B1D7B]|uniref:antibiotic biosynthesis monooxygenase family protein n=1 Tax=Sphingobium sp. B1D7B TaxID=2940578 RepID=UPI002224961A|nr:antibiotic biosynthesis monooxygenase [Sphingobium sp. B1D7B]MCW2406871.1 quinol monooxygenase YgiN [Sphingobium sp. B1D7B]